MIHGLYTLEEVAQLSGLKISTLKVYAMRGNSTLVRGRDFTTLRRYRFGRCQHKIVFTKKGVERLIARDFRRLTDAKIKPTRKEREILDRLYREVCGVNLGSPNTIEGKLRRKQLRMVELARFLEKNSCSITGCGCICHSLVDGEYPVILDANASPPERVNTGIAEAVFVAGKDDVTE
jgi:hypothetical protein